MKGAVKRGRLSHVQLPNKLLWKWQIDPRRTLLRGTYSVVDVDIFRNDCTLDSRPLILRFGCFVALSSPRGISFVHWKIFKFAAWNLQNVIWSFIRCYSKTISYNIKWQVNHPQLKVTSQFSLEMHVILTNRLCIIFLKETNFLHFYNWKQLHCQ